VCKTLWCTLQRRRKHKTPCGTLLYKTIRGYLLFALCFFSDHQILCTPMKPIGIMFTKNPRHHLLSLPLKLNPLRSPLFLNLILLQIRLHRLLLLVGFGPAPGYVLRPPLFNQIKTYFPQIYNFNIVKKVPRGPWKHNRFELDQMFSFVRKYLIVAGLELVVDTRNNMPF